MLRATQDITRLLRQVVYGTFTLYGRLFQAVPLCRSLAFIVILQPRRCRNIDGLGYSAFARHYLRNHFCFLLLWVLRCFGMSGPRLTGCPIRISRHQGLFAPTPGFSQLITSFVASESLGIHRLPLLTFFAYLRTVSHPESRLICL